MLFILNLVSIVLVGVATFWLKGVHRHSEDSQLVIGTRFERRRSLLRGMWRDAFARVRKLQTDTKVEPSATAVALSQLRVEVGDRPRRGHSPYAGSSVWGSMATLGGSGRSSAVSHSSDTNSASHGGEQGRFGTRSGIAKGMSGSAMDIL